MTALPSLTFPEPALYSAQRRIRREHPLEIKDLEAKIDELIQLIDALERKQASLSKDQENWRQERARLVEKNDLAKNKVEAMIMRLKALDQD